VSLLLVAVAMLQALQRPAPQTHTQAGGCC
jgi:hypothetical protein